MPTGVYERPPAEDRFWAKVSPEPNSGCWLWDGATSHNGYPMFSFGQKIVYAHRWYYEQINGSVWQDLDLDHKCRVRCCVNPDHLEPVTRAENLGRGAGVYGKLKTHCKNGHLLTPETTYTRTDRPGHRECLTCRNLRNAARYTNG